MSVLRKKITFKVKEDKLKKGLKLQPEDDPDYDPFSARLQDAGVDFGSDGPNMHRQKTKILVKKDKRESKIDFMEKIQEVTGGY